MTSGQPPVINGWTLFAHPVFIAQAEALAAQVETLRAKDPSGYRSRNASKRLAAIARLAFDVIPQDPTRGEYRQGDALGTPHRHWFRAKFFQQYRLFFRFQTQARIIVHGWINDQETLRAYDSPDDAYRVFRRMLEHGRPPTDWESLLAEAREESGRLARIAKHGDP
jgi:toxin YhaV